MLQGIEQFFFLVLLLQIIEVVWILKFYSLKIIRRIRTEMTLLPQSGRLVIHSIYPLPRKKLNCFRVI